MLYFAHLLVFVDLPQSVFDKSVIITDRVRSTREGYVLTRVCPSICLSTPRGTPARSRWGYPTSGTPHQTWLGGYPDQGVPHLGYPPVRPGQGYPNRGYPTSGTSPVRPGQGVPLLGYPHQTWPGEVPHQGGTPPQVPPPSDLAGEGVPHRVVLDTPRSVCLLRSRRTFLSFEDVLPEMRYLLCLSSELSIYVFCFQYDMRTHIMQ